ncbi:hypothetical protein BKA70DRAFT_1118967 [Coprinopsis sp. MPI-PUGE-AT-0042]|nr:hypothetical protein BKA70DRAFT_1118967 [Coprinopsis sp. MPI-PUGE-AT-0042]
MASALLFQSILATPQGLSAWLKTTNATVDFIGSDFSTPLGPQEIRLIYCTQRIGSTCGGKCIAYQGPGAQCLLPAFRSSSCLAATMNVLMCYKGDCSDCNRYANCGEKLADGFCSTPNTHSIQLFIPTGESLIFRRNVD